MTTAHTTNEKGHGCDPVPFRNHTINGQDFPTGEEASKALATFASEINAIHKKAVKAAGAAIEFAKQAGAMLLKVKAALPHGEFLPWLEVNCSVSPRQAQRYMASANGKPIPIRVVKSDTASHLVEEPEIVIPLGSVGDVEWQDSEGNHLYFEAHPFLFPDGTTIGLKCVYMLAGPDDHSGAYVEYDRRGINAKTMDLRKRAAKYRVPLELMTISKGEAPLWESMHQMDLHDSLREAV